jgi:hypothetical protein
MSDATNDQDTDRRGKGDSEPPGGVERRRSAARKKIRSSEGRERYLDMVQRERALLLDQGIPRSTEQLLDMAGAIAPSRPRKRKASRTAPPATSSAPFFRFSHGCRFPFT